MNPSRYQLPQYVSADRQRARAHTLASERRRFALRPDVPGARSADGSAAADEEEAADFRRLPPTCARLPTELDFPMSMISTMGLDRLWTILMSGVGAAASLLHPLTRERGYRQLFRLMNGPDARVARWKEDTEFGRQRMTGVNPMHLRVCRDRPAAPLWEAAQAVLAAQQDSGVAKLTLDEVFHRARLFMVEYGILADPRVQKHAAAGSRLAAPTCLLWNDDFGNLRPLAIQLKPPVLRDKNPVFTPLHAYPDWMMARAYVEAADSHVHEASYHLLETHLVSGAVALCMYRELHPDHPLRQLLEPHYEYNLAINRLALGGLLKKGGTIDHALSAGVPGALNAARMHYARWSFTKQRLHLDLAERGVDRSETLPQYYYREDALRVYDAIDKYVGALLGLFYRGDADVAQDYELQAFVRAAASPQDGDIPGFPAQVRKFTDLKDLATDLIFRAGPQHAAVNNGQFEAYGWIPARPGIIRAELPDELLAGQRHFTEQQLWEAMPRLGRSLAQMAMVWVLSKPTKRSLLHAGESPAFHPKLCFQADEIIGAFRRRLLTISNSIQRRNERLQQPYCYLDPLNISRSTDI